jgi:carbonic anhydrase
MVENGEIGIVGGMYDVESGMVHFYETDTKQKQKLVLETVG